MSLRSERAEFQSIIEFQWDILSGHPPVEEIPDLCEQVGAGLRALAKARILLDADSDAFFHTLAQSAEVRTYFLRRCNALPGFKPPQMATGNGTAIFDALAARHFGLARDLAVLSPKVWWEGEEYEDDFCFVHFVHLYAANGVARAAEMQDTLARFERALDGQDSARLAVCRALFVKDQEGFEDAFSSLLDERDTILEDDKEKFFPDKLIYYTKRRIYVEGLGILCLAERAGLQTPGPFRYCPPLCRRPMRTPFPVQPTLTAP